MLKAIGRLQITPRHGITPRRAARTIQTAMIQIEKNFRHGHARNCTSSYQASSEVDASRRACRQQQHGRCSSNSVGISIFKNRDRDRGHRDSDTRRQRQRRTDTETHSDAEAHTETRRHRCTHLRTETQMLVDGDGDSDDSDLQDIGGPYVRGHDPKIIYIYNFIHI